MLPAYASPLGPVLRLCSSDLDFRRLGSMLDIICDNAGRYEITPMMIVSLSLHIHAHAKSSVLFFSQHYIVDICWFPASTERRLVSGVLRHFSRMGVLCQYAAYVCKRRWPVPFLSLRPPLLPVNIVFVQEDSLLSSSGTGKRRANTTRGW